MKRERRSLSRPAIGEKILRPSRPSFALVQADAGARRVACVDVLGALAERSADYQTMQGYVSGWVVVRGEYGASGKNDRRTAMRKKREKLQDSGLGRSCGKRSSVLRREEENGMRRYLPGIKPGLSARNLSVKSRKRHRSPLVVPKKRRHTAEYPPPL